MRCWCGRGAPVLKRRKARSLHAQHASPLSVARGWWLPASPVTECSTRCTATPWLIRAYAEWWPAWCCAALDFGADFVCAGLGRYAATSM